MSRSRIAPPARHFVLKTPMEGALGPNDEEAIFGMGCFWGAERKFYQAPGVVTTAVGYAGGHVEHPTYKETCTGRTGHAEVVRVVFDRTKTSYKNMLDLFWDNHNPTQVDGQGNDHGPQYRSCLFYFSPEQKEMAERTRDAFQVRLDAKGYPKIVTQISPAPVFYYAEDYHQQYLAKNPGGYCGLKSTGCYRSGDVNAARKDDL